MKIQKLLESRSPLFETLGLKDQYFETWEREIHPTLCEAALSTDQIMQMFADVEKDASATGKNRTLLGKGKDAAGTISDAWFNKFGAMLKKSAPVAAADAKFKELKNKIRAANPDSKVIAAIDKYAEYAEKHPAMQKFLLAIVGSIAAALGVAAAGGIAAGALAIGTGTGVAVGIVNIADRLLKGEDLSTAVGRGGTAGLTAGLTAAAVAKVAGFFKDTLANIQQGKEVHVITVNAGTPMAQKFNMLPKDAQAYDNLVQKWLDANATPAGGIDALMDPNSPANKAMKAAQTGIDALIQKVADPSYQQAVIAAAAKAGETAAPIADAIKGITTLQQVITPVASALAGQAAGNAAKESVYVQARPLSEGQVYLLFNRIVAQELTEAPAFLNKLGAAVKGGVKGAAGVVGDKLKQVGKNLTNKTTSDKLRTAWTKAGSPTDSDAVYKLLKDQGVDAEVINSVYDSMKLATPAQPAASDDAATDTAPEQDATSDQSVAATSTAAEPTSDEPASDEPTADTAPAGKVDINTLAAEIKKAGDEVIGKVKVKLTKELKPAF
jgi:hypothetical protein